MVVYDACFSLSDLLYSVWQSLGPSTTLKMVLFCPFIWTSNVPLYTCATPSLSTLLWTFRLLQGLAILNSAAMNIRVHISF